jgi:hypothetical protein
MAWYAVYEEATGRLRSLGQVVADPLPAGLVAASLDSLPDLKNRVWDDVARGFVNRPPEVLVDRLQDLVDDPLLGAVWSRLTVAQRQALRERLVRLLGPRRWRIPTEPVDIEEVERET